MNKRAFFGRSLAGQKIEIKTDGVNSNCPDLLRRLGRIESNYSKLDGLLTELEARFELDDRLNSEDSQTPQRRLTRKKPK